MHRASWRSIALIAALALPATASAQGTPWLAGTVGFHTYGMSDVNDTISELNDLIYPYSMDEIHSGFGFGAGVGMDLPAVSLGLTYERLTGSSDVSDGTGSIEFDLPANLYMAQAVFRPGSYGAPFTFGVGVGAGLVASSGEIRTTDPLSGTDTQELEGNGGAFAAFLTADLSLAPRFALVPSVGYRYAKISEVKSGGDVLYNGDGSKFELDYSGLMAKLALKISL